MNELLQIRNFATGPHRNVENLSIVACHGLRYGLVVLGGTVTQPTRMLSTRSKQRIQPELHMRA